MKGQSVYRGGPIGWLVVFTRIAQPRSKYERWEVELTSPEGVTRFYFYRWKWIAHLRLRDLGIKPLRRVR